jgi:Arc/MetJ family transcription regulator
MGRSSDANLTALVGVSKVYDVCMSRTNIDLDDELVAEAMRKFGLKTKKEAVDLALRRLVGPRLSPEFIESLEGIGWEGDLDEMRRSKIQDWPEIEDREWS